MGERKAEAREEAGALPPPAPPLCLLLTTAMPSPGPPCTAPTTVARHTLPLVLPPQEILPSPLDLQHPHLGFTHPTYLHKWGNTTIPNAKVRRWAEGSP